jgi:membrane protein YdbS with pleckstrin-like domain
MTDETFGRLWMDEDELLENEQIEKVLSPHPFSFMRFQSLCFFLIIWGVIVGWLVTFSPIKVWFTNFGAGWLPLIIWSLVLLLIAVLASLVTTRWSVFILYLVVVIGGVLPVGILNWLPASALFIPLYSLACAIVGFVLIEAYRRSHKYIITNFRIIFSDGMATKQERTLRYDRISAVNTRQGLLGRVLGFGTIIPGTGHADTPSASHKKGKKAVEEAKEMSAPVVHNLYELHGVYPFKETKKFLEKLVQDTVITPYQKQQVSYQKQQVDIQKEMRELMKKQVTTSKKDDDADDEEKPEKSTMHIKRIAPFLKSKVEKPAEEEALEPEHVDVQKQMKELLKKRDAISIEEAQEEAEEEEEPEEEEKEKKEGA